MSTAKNKAVEHYRKRLKERGLVRLEVQVSETDASLIRQLAKALRDDPARASEIRGQLRQLISDEQKLGLKALLASAPLEGIDLTRIRDKGRDIDV